MIDPALPAASIIIPTRHRPGALERCLAALRAQDYPSSRLEIVVVLDGAQAAPVGLGDSVTLVRQDKAGPAAARNRGAEAAGGDLLAFTDDDCEPVRDWLRNLVERCRKAPWAGAGGRTVNAVTENGWSETAELIVTLARTAASPALPFFASNNLALNADGFRSIGGFDPSFCTPGAEDRDLCDRWSLAGLPLLYEPAAVVRHHHHHSARTFFCTHLDYGAGAYRLSRARSARGATGVIDRRFYLAILRACAAGGPVRTARLALWQAANLIGFGGAWFDDQRAHPARAVSLQERQLERGAEPRGGRGSAGQREGGQQGAAVSAAEAGRGDQGRQQSAGRSAGEVQDHR
jgi:GT2 family glycosyltransferase